MLAFHSCTVSEWFTTMANDFRMRLGMDASDKIIHWKVFAIGYHGHAVTHKPMITPAKACLHLEWYKQHCHWTVDQWWERGGMNRGTWHGGLIDASGPGRYLVGDSYKTELYRLGNLEAVVWGYFSRFGLGHELYRPGNWFGQDWIVSNGKLEAIGLELFFQVWTRPLFLCLDH